MNQLDPAYILLLSEQYPSADEAAAALIDTRMQLQQPKPTELFVSDVHGEYEEFSHILRSACGGIRERIRQLFDGILDEAAQDELACIVYYPEEKVPLVAASLVDEEERASWYRVILVHIAAVFGSFAVHSDKKRVEASLPAPFRRLVANMGAPTATEHGRAHRLNLADQVLRIGYADPVITAAAHGIQQLAVGRLHLVGDIFDRGPAPDRILDELMAYHAVDIQWGNHDIVWMGAALGQAGCIAHVVRNCARYANLDILTDGYGIDLMPLIDFARTAYADDPCAGFGLKGEHPELSADQLDLNVKVQKAMAIIQFKVEGQLIDQYPSFGLEDRKLLHRIDRSNWIIEIDGTTYPLTDRVFPTVDFNDPYTLTEGERRVVVSLQHGFQHSDKLQKHIRFLLQAGSLYTVYNDTLMYHACVPLNADGTLMDVNLFGETYHGKALFDAVEKWVRTAFDTSEPEDDRRHGRDLIWYLWLGKGSPLFAKSKMATFEIYLIADKAARKEVKNPYYSLLEDETVIRRILEDFGVNADRGRIVSGHVPVKVCKGEDPVKCGGKALIIDGGMSHAYQNTTGIAGFTLISDAHGVRLATHDTFVPRDTAIRENLALHSTYRVLDAPRGIVHLADTQAGKPLAMKAEGLACLLDSYRSTSRTGQHNVFR
jgi:fructose-1,6-bisphosphatase-3